MRFSTYKDAMENTPVLLTLKIDNSQPIPLNLFVNSLTSLAEEYRKEIHANDDFLSDDAEIYVKQIRSGSIIADLIPFASASLPLILSEADKVFVAVDFVKKWEGRLRSLASGVVPEGATQSDLKRWADAVENIARDPDSSSTLEAAEFSDEKREVKASFTFNSNDAVAIRNTVQTRLELLTEQKSDNHSRVLMVFTRSDIGSAPVGRKSGERVLIQEVSSKPLAITYGSELAEERIKFEIRESYENIYKKGFNVDVKVQFTGSRPVAYSIMHVHDVIELPD